MIWQLEHGSALDVLPRLPAGSVQCCVTSPPYWGLRDYGHAAQIGLEETPAEYVAALVAVFAAVRRVLRRDGVLWLNLGDGHATAEIDGLKPKDLVGTPWRVAFALQAAGWYLRSDVIWAKPNPNDAAAIAEPALRPDGSGITARTKFGADVGRPGGQGVARSVPWTGTTRNARSVWEIAPEPSQYDHYALMPKALARRCILAGCAPGATVLDPFAGAGTSGVVALEEGRSFVGIEISAKYHALSRARLLGTMPLFAHEAAPAADEIAAR